MDFSRLNIHVKNDSAEELDIFEVEKELGGKLPDVYKMVLRRMNGFLLDEGVCLYGTDDLCERNSTWEVSIYAAGYIAIGDDSGGTVLLMPFEENTTTVIGVDAGDMNPLNGVTVASDIANWINNGCQMVY
ncbi:SMI1/KNR4 family protein [Paenibacillus methanolicus]|uniref:SUKH superfamily protein n=1 Tax=Paenibacillus methanolicus TaxID=582686 RepID=A0A5S5BMK8_9BACL|nr:SMI1/KNR4 family protein [Paenibacillus methanolicus]TYP67390.1 SUKH superfamily protein [Paenibacillus methanolicus]